MKQHITVGRLLIVGVCALSLIGCGTGGQSSAPNTSPESTAPTSAAPAPTASAPAASGKATFWNDKWANNAETQKAVADAWTKTSGLTIDVNSFPDTASYQTAMSQSIGDAGSAPNAFTWWSGDQLQTLAQGNQLMPLDDVWQKIIPLGVSPDIEKALSFNGHAYAVPFSLLNNLVVYNAKAFAKAGITAPPKTFDEFLADCQKLVDAGIKPISLKNDSWASFIWFQALMAAADPALYQGVCDGSIKYTDPKVVAVFTTWHDMLAKGFFADPVSGDDAGKRVATGEAAMFIESPYAVTSFVTNFGLKSGTDFSAFALPSMTGGKAAIFFEVSPMAVPAVVKDPATSKAMLEAYYSTDVQTQILNSSGFALTNTVPVTDPTLEKIASMSADTAHYQSILRYYENTPAALRDVALDEMAKFMAGQQDAKTTLSHIQAKADTTFK